MLVGTLLTVVERLVPADCEYTSFAPSWVPTHNQYWLTPDPLVQLNVTVDELRADPGAGETISAGVEPDCADSRAGGRAAIAKMTIRAHDHSGNTRWLMIQHPKWKARCQ